LAERLGAFLEFNEYEILENLGTVKASVARAIADGEYSEFRVKQDREYESDFDRDVMRIIKEKKEDT